MPEAARTLTRPARWGGALLIVGTLQYVVAQLVAAAAWSTPYSWNRNYISDLGVTSCGELDLPHGGVELVCSPLHAVMNASFALSGILLVVGIVLLWSYWPPGPAAKVGSVLLIMAGAGKVLTGMFPENTQLSLHLLGALNIPLGALGVLLLSVSLLRHRGGSSSASWLGVAGLVLSIIGLVASALSSAAQVQGPAVLLGLGAGAMERLAGYPTNLWLLLLGVSVLAQRTAVPNDVAEDSAAALQRG